MRALLIVNPFATATTRLRREVIARALASGLDLKVAETRYRGHAAKVAEAAAREGYGVVLTLGGDGTVNEAVNGLMRAHPPPAAPPGAASLSVASPPPASPPPASPPGESPAASPPPASPPAADPPAPAPAPSAGPALAALPGGNANVFTRALGLPADPVDATGRILAAIESGSSRPIGLGLAGHRYFCFNAGLGIDAEVVRAVEGLRARGEAASASLYLRATVRHFLTVTDRRHPALTLERDGMPDSNGLFCAIVSNTAQWTFLGDRPLKASPLAGFDTGLDLFALRKLSTFRALSAVRQMLRDDGRPPHGKHIVSLHDEPGFTFRATRPIAFQVDGEYVGERECVTFRAIPNALRVIA